MPGKLSDHPVVSGPWSVGLLVWMPTGTFNSGCYKICLFPVGVVVRSRRRHPPLAGMCRLRVPFWGNSSARRAGVELCCEKKSGAVPVAHQKNEAVWFYGLRKRQEPLSSCLMHCTSSAAQSRGTTWRSSLPLNGCLTIHGTRFHSRQWRSWCDIHPSTFWLTCTRWSTTK